MVVNSEVFVDRSKGWILNFRFGSTTAFHTSLILEKRQLPLRVVLGILVAANINIH